MTAEGVSSGWSGNVRRCWFPVPAELEDARCAVCGAEGGELLLPHDSFGFPTELVSCRGCGFVYVTPRPTEAYMRRFYQEHYLAFYEGCRELTEEYIRMHFLREAAGERVERYAHLVPEGGRVLDIGCGGGFSLAAIREARRVEVQGIEPGAMQARYATKSLGIPVYQGVYQDFEISERFDFVTAFHVTEHIHDLTGYFRFVRAAVVDGGYVAIESPNLEGSWSDISMFHVAHLYAFTPRSLERLALCHGFSVVETRTADRGWDWPNLHVTLRADDGAGEMRAGYALISDELKARVRSVRVARWQCVVRSWIKLALHYLGLGILVDRRRQVKRGWSQ